VGVLLRQAKERADRESRSGRRWRHLDVGWPRCPKQARRSWYVGGRDSEAAMIFMDDLAKRLANRVQLTSDGHKAYLEAVEGAFGSDIDYAMLVKVYGPAPEGQRRYSPAECIGAVKHRVEGNPDPKHVSTSYAERQNLNIRMGNRRMTRLTNAFSKKAENHAHMMAIYFMHYNFVRIHQTLKVTPAMAAGVTAKLWEMADMVKVLEDWEIKNSYKSILARLANALSQRFCSLPQLWG
jgi:hypothetical protein